MIPRPGGGGRHVNPGKADEVFAEHAILDYADIVAITVVVERDR